MNGQRVCWSRRLRGLLASKGLHVMEEKTLRACRPELVRGHRMSGLDLLLLGLELLFEGLDPSRKGLTGLRHRRNATRGIARYHCD